jgi:hypothetical protein
MRKAGLGSPIRATIRPSGARPLKRVIQKEVQDPLAEMILAGELADRRTVAISAKAGIAIDGRAVGKSRVIEKGDGSDAAGIVVRFPKGA